MPDLESQLTRARTDLLDAIDQPPLDQITGRATGLRRRRRLRAAAALAAVVAAGIFLVRPWAADPVAEVPPADAPPSGPVYAGAGITINGLTEKVPDVPDLPGAITDVEFTDSSHGYLVTDQMTFARTGDGGLTWQQLTPPNDPGGDLFSFPDGTLALGAVRLSDDGGTTWRQVPEAGGPAAAAAGEDDLLRLGPQNTVQVWSSTHGNLGDLSATLPITPTWVAARPTADNAWWIGGTLNNGQPAAAVSRDGGRHWQAVPLDAPAGQVGTVQVSVLGRHAYAIVLGPRRDIRAILHSADAGQTFTRTRGPGEAEPSALAGEAVPLLDGRLLVTTSSRWYVSSDDGATFKEASGSLPVVGAVHRTWAGYVAYDLFGPAPAGWAAFSTDGATWRKLQVR